MTDGKDIAEYCVKLGSELGAKYVEARYENERARGLAFRNGEPVSGGTAPSAGIGVRLLVDGNMGFAAFDRMDREIARNAIQAALKMARNTQREQHIDLGEPVANKAKWTMDVKEPLSDVDIDTLMSTAKELNAQMKDLDQFVLMMNPTVIDKYIVTSEGTEITGHISYIKLSTILTAKGKVDSEQKLLNLTQSGGWERIKEAKVVETLGDEVRELQKAALTAKKVPELMERPIDMIVGPEVTGIIAHENVGHASEGDRIMGREGAQAGESFWIDLKIGESRVGSDAVTVSDDPTIPNTVGFYLYDNEGVKARKRVLIKNGILNEPLLNREFGAKFGTGSNGAARASKYNREPIIRMATTYLEPGDYSLEELVEDVKLGCLMKSFMEWNIDDRRSQSKYTGCVAYLIKNGELTDTMVRRPVMEITSVGLLSAVDAVSNNLRLDFPANCGKSDPMQAINVNAGGGDVRFRAIRLGGVG